LGGETLVNFRVLFKSVRFAFRAKKRVLAFILIYAILFLVVAYGLGDPGYQILYFAMAFVVSTVYAILISQFRRKDIAILKCLSWGNNEILLLLIGEVILVSFAAFLVVFQLSVEILGVIKYLNLGDQLLNDISAVISLDFQVMLAALGVVVFAQIPGLIIAQIRAMRIPPMRALREE
jgi:predicted lysophospholipase L1 biosynthesis ABC-type transport system permease subunit